MKGRPGERERAEGLRKGKRTPSRGKRGMSPKETRRYRRRMKHQTQPLNYLIHSAYPHLSYLFVTGFEVSLHVLQFKIFYESTKKTVGLRAEDPHLWYPCRSATRPPVRSPARRARRPANQTFPTKTNRRPARKESAFASTSGPHRGLSRQTPAHNYSERRGALSLMQQAGSHNSSRMRS